MRLRVGATHLVNGALLAALFVGSALAWPQLPDSIPAHFGAGGRADRWTTTSWASWFAVPLFALGLTVFNYALAHLLPRWPHLINLPSRAQFMALPAERQVPVIERIQGLLYGTSGPLIMLMGLIQLAIYRTARGEPSEGYMLAVLLCSVILTPLILGVWLPQIQRELDRQVREHRAGTDD